MTFQLTHFVKTFIFTNWAFKQLVRYACYAGTTKNLCIVAIDFSWGHSPAVYIYISIYIKKNSDY